MRIFSVAAISTLSFQLSHAFAPLKPAYSATGNRFLSSSTHSVLGGQSFVGMTATEAESTSATKLTTEDAVSQLKKILAKEYTSFFSPMYRDYYSPDVTFTDPMTSFSGIDKYQNNVDMLASRTLMGSILFTDAGIALHKVTGGELDDNGNISNIITRWTLRVTAKAIPWKPTAVFSGISVYEVVPSPSSSVGVQILHQTDYWDSVNIKPDGSGEYQKVDKGLAVQDFVGQLKPGGFEAQAAGPELPYQLLRKGDGYEVRSYPAFNGATLPYNRRDEGLGSLGAFTRGMSPLAPALMEVQSSDTSDKFMTWPLAYTAPGETSPPEPKEAMEKAGEGQWRTIRVTNEPAKIIAVGRFSDASMEPVVRIADRELREALKRDGLVPAKSSEDTLRFAQYDAVFSMGQRRGEVWIELEEGGHPW
mmetsp:Transcript_9161/g.12736  ORF Transcript_9161/g.12736 Transcript_9161/m.12736 type:complete len:420 (-) Transcript_9161:95-1354(-)|eukprot:CAMPEP_0185730218 /NCGR_PEP_ID=MMETSP1171-20130828/8955_1 /TAXON_ID=374046 /ORGANISM="Helicotheca tamensis, Strain CCMP826" /LENGTH=419 /DNA_ID=CAMNT_0028399223 /DNA_START=131 /DNA_END=1390 /DNA_ORIENTATION=-